MNKRKNNDFSKLLKCIDSFWPVGAVVTCVLSFFAYVTFDLMIGTKNSVISSTLLSSSIVWFAIPLVLLHCSLPIEQSSLCYAKRFDH